MVARVQADHEVLAEPLDRLGSLVPSTRARKSLADLVPARQLARWSPRTDLIFLPTSSRDSTARTVSTSGSSGIAALPAPRPRRPARPPSCESPRPVPSDRAVDRRPSAVKRRAWLGALAGHLVAPGAPRPARLAPTPGGRLFGSERAGVAASAREPLVQARGARSRAAASRPPLEVDGGDDRLVGVGEQRRVAVAAAGRLLAAARGAAARRGRGARPRGERRLADHAWPGAPGRGRPRARSRTRGRRARRSPGRPRRRRGTRGARWTRGVLGGVARSA